MSSFVSIVELIKKGESQTIEFKTSFQKEVIISVVSFANAKGGQIFIGVHDSGKILGIEIKQESLQDWINQIKLNTQPSIEKLQSGNYSSRARNRAIARAFKEAGIIERYGSGIARIKNECRIHGVKEPIFEEFIHGFRVTLFKEKLDGVVNGVVNSDIDSLYIFIKDNPNKNDNTISKALKIPLRTIQRKLKKLKDDNKIEFVGSPKIGGYYAKK